MMATNIMIAITLIVIAVFVGIDALIEGGGSADVPDRIITSDSVYVMNITQAGGGTCVDGATVALYRLHRRGNLVIAEVQGSCTNTSSVGPGTLNLDLDFSDFPSAFRCPSGDGSDPNTLGGGTALVGGSDINTIVQIEADPVESEVDMEIRFGSAVPDGSDIEFVASFIYKSKSCA